MKKSLLTLVGAMLLGLCAMAQVPVSETLQAPANAPSLAPTDDGYQLKFCGTINTWTKVSSLAKSSIRAYIYITPDVATKLAGNQVTDVTFSVAYTGAVQEHPATVFVSEDLSAEPVAVKDLTSVNNYETNPLTYNTAEFDEPYTITEGKGFYIGYTISGLTSNDYPVAIDKSTANPFAGMIDVYDGDGEYVGTVDAATNFDHNIYITANTVGENKELLDLCTASLSTSNFDLPIVEDGKALEVKLNLTNLGSNRIRKVTYVIDNGDGKLTEGSSTVSVNTLRSSATKITVPETAQGHRTVTVKVTAINDEPADLTAACSYIGMSGEGYDRAFVVEEGTGTWCGWCPRGIVGLESMETKYPDTFIGIAVHAWNGDRFQTSSYMPLIDKFFEGFPSCVINRDKNFCIDPSFSTLETAYNKWVPQVGAAKVEITGAQINDEETAVAVTTNTTFAFSEDNAQYRLAYVVMEDGLTGSQANYYSGGGSGTMGGWEKKGQTVAWTFTNTARNIYDCWGIEESVPATIVEGQPIEYVYDVPMANVKKASNSIIVVMLLDAESGVVLNAAKIKAADYTADVKEVALDKTSIQLPLGASETLVATVYPANATDKTLTWTSSDTDIVTVDQDGNVTAVGLGEAVITVTCGGVTATCDVTVTANDGIIDIMGDADDAFDVYNVQGIRIDGDNLPAGLYIIKRGNKVTKSIIR